ncbi:MAG: protease inhibitor I42 family protein [Myxococcota bacterium]
MLVNRTRHALVLSTLMLGLAVAACSDDTAADGPLPAPLDDSGKADLAVYPTVALTEADDGTAVDLPVGHALRISLAADTSTGYRWRVRTTSKTLGTPKINFNPTTADKKTGTFIFTFTPSPLWQVGDAYDLVLELSKKGVSRAKKLFDISVTVVSAAGVVVTSADKDGTVEVAEGSSVELRLVENPTTGYRWYVTSTDRTFGYPSDDTFEAPDSSAVGAPGIRVLTWETGGLVKAGESHKVTLKKQRGETGSSVDSFTFTVDVVSPE